TIFVIPMILFLRCDCYLIPKIPCIFPCYQGIGYGDWFALHWLVSQAMIYPLQAMLDLAYLSAQSFPKLEETL
ncbi:MAG: hypothetical protein WBF64_05765, partial [Xanthobacteraceae bacterium]